MVGLDIRVRAGMLGAAFAGEGLAQHLAGVGGGRLGVTGRAQHTAHRWAALPTTRRPCVPLT